MINNRQNGRRRGRGGGGQRPGGGQGQRDSGNRIDSRARGNASQLYEKYKSMAADAQRQGDRVNTEYYLQFADHYFRVLAEQRGRFDEQNQRRTQADSYDEDEDFGDEGEVIRGDEQKPSRRNDRERFDRNPRRDDRRDGDGDGEQREAPRPRRDEQPRAAEAERPANDVEAAPRRRGRTRRVLDDDAAGDTPSDGPDTGLDADRLPPALGAATGAGDTAEEGAERPRRRRGRPPAAEAQIG